MNPLYEPSDFYRDLCALYQIELSGEKSYRELIDMSLELTKKADSNPEVLGVISHAVWHYIIDFDIRAKDKIYAKGQFKVLDEELEILRLELGIS